MNKKRVGTLAIEVTRSCNAKCEHCLRGNAQKVDIDTKYIDKLLENVTDIDTIAFTGGEPTLNISAIRYTLNQVRKMDIFVGYVYVVTNAIKYSVGLIRVMNDWFKYCYEKNTGCYISSGEMRIAKDQMCNFGEVYDQNIIDYMENGSFGLSVSFDDFHPDADPKAIRLYKSQFYYRDDKDQRKSNSGFNRNLISEGRAKTNGLGRRVLSKEYKFYVIDDDWIETIYLNAKGYILPDCNFSYGTQSSMRPENIMNKSLEEIVKRKKRSVA